MGWVKTTARQDKKHLSFGIWYAIYYMADGRKVPCLVCCHSIWCIRHRCCRRLLSGFSRIGLTRFPVVFVNEEVPAPFECTAKAYLLDWYTGRSLSPETRFGPRVLSLPPSVCVLVRVRRYVYQPRACLCKNSSPIQARIANFEQRCKTT